MTELDPNERKALSRAVRGIKSCKDRIAQARDELRGLLSEVLEIVPDADAAIESLDDCIDKLSQYL